ncbi:MAG: DsbC family protein [Gammaproteobacteria bacterium]|nr:DsbC family protein [Gammaproteobacteria bacterium]
MTKILTMVSYSIRAKWFILLCLFGLSGLSYANSHDKVDSSDKDIEILTKSLSTIMPGIDPSSIETTPIEGLFEVSFGPRIFYFNKDATLMFKGDLIKLQTKENLTEIKRSQSRAKLIEAMGEDNMVVFKAPQEKYKITVFTDIDCPYCTKMHKEMPAYNTAGISVRYMAYPRAGVGSSSYLKAVNVWCSKDKNKAMTDAKNGLNVTSPSCENPVERQFELGQVVGVTGTPAIFLHDGKLIPGYVPALRLKEMLDSTYTKKSTN